MDKYYLPNGKELTSEQAVKRSNTLKPFFHFEIEGDRVSVFDVRNKGSHEIYNGDIKNLPEFLKRLSNL